MRISALNSSFARGCVILSLLVCVRALSAAEAAQPRTSLQERLSAYAEAGLNDPCAVSRTTTTNANPQSSESVVPLAKLLSRTKNRLESSNAKADASVPKELWDSRITLPQGDEEVETSLALRRLIRQVRSVKFAAQEQAPTFTPPAEPKPGFQAPPIESIENDVTSSSVSTPAAGASNASPALTVKARQTLDVLEKNPNRVQDPLEVAELLFLSGQLTEAAPFYTKALDQISRINPSYDADRAWILFQLGNCLRETDITRAQEVYMKLVSEYPSSPWTELAKAHGRLLTWYQKSRTDRQANASQL